MARISARCRPRHRRGRRVHAVHSKDDPRCKDDLVEVTAKGKAGGPSFDPKLPKSVRIYTTSLFPEWKGVCASYQGFVLGRDG